ncbi:PAAR domain-containing protein [Lysobacter firmicutimachus]|uniref:PAAR domain-containing protein n=1 Tax=Lysobacter firmicutimachus TaxID=1792846 RepID=A0ABU8D1M0_9GAMM
MVRHRIQVGDTTSGGGSVVAGAPAQSPGGPSWARVGDAVQCGVHGATTVATGDAQLRIDGRAVARHGDFCACGCILISQRQIRSIVEHGRGFAVEHETGVTD